jgi:tripartite ATP-independent transporter DctM subunit
LTKATNVTPELYIPIWPFLAFIGFSLTVAALVSFCNTLRHMAVLLTEGKGFWMVMAVLAGMAAITFPFWFQIFDVRFGKMAVGVAIWLIMIGLLFLRLPLAYAMGVTGAIGLCLVSKNISAGLALTGIAPFNAMQSFVLVSVPLFILMGEITSKSGISRDLFEAAAVWFGRMPGGLAISAVVGCASFAAICGESLPTAVTMSSVALPEMQHMKYDDSLACGAIAAGGTLGILIPPSIGFIFYSIVTEQSVGMLFMAGVIPGLMLAGLFILAIAIIATRNPALAPSAGRTAWEQKFRSLRKVIGFMTIFMIIIIGIMSGIMNPTEASAIGCVGSILVAIASGNFSWKKFLHCLEDTVTISARLLFILAAVGILGYFLALTRLPTSMGNWIMDLGLGRYTTMFIIIAIWVALGCVMNVIPMILLTLPAIYPTVEMLGFDPIWFGVLAVVIMEMGQLTPPVGIVCFAVSSVGKVPLEKVFRGIVPFFLCMWVIVGLLLLFPDIATWLPYLLFK